MSTVGGRAVVRQKQQIAGRIQQIIQDKSRTVTAFKRQFPAVAKTVDGWIPRPTLWNWIAERSTWEPKRTRGRTQSSSDRTEDWARVRVPGGLALVKFCDLTGARSGYILEGEGAPYRGQSRETAELAADLAAHVTREVLTAAGEMAAGMSANVVAILEDTVAMVRSDLDEWLARFGPLQAELRELEASFPNYRSFRFEPRDPTPRPILRQGSTEYLLEQAGYRRASALDQEFQRGRVIDEEIAKFGGNSSRYFVLDEPPGRSIEFRAAREEP